MKTAHDLVLAAKALCTEVSVKDAAEALRTADVVIDVREANEYAAGHLAGAINIPRGVLEFNLSATAAFGKPDLRVVLYCKTSGRSALAAVSMQTMGYRNVVSLAGGYDAWVAEGMETTKPIQPVFD
jgi:rhodanese-related sulfurtransferase